MIRKAAISFSLVFFLLTASAAGQESFESFWQKFKAAVVAKNKAAVAGMAKLPFSLGYDPSARGKVGVIRTKTDFLRRYKYIFDGEVDAVKCFNSGKPEAADNQYVFACAFRTEPPEREKPFLYTFQRTKSGWRLTEFTNINE